jgi:hypothetical protein
MPNSDRVLREADEVLRRHSERARSLSSRARSRRAADIGARIKRIVIACVAILIAAAAIGFFVPLGGDGVMFTLAAMILAVLIFAGFPLRADVKAEALVDTELKELPLKTEQWLEKQRPALPAPAVRLVDDIGVRLETLAPQLETLDPREPAAAEVRRLIGQELPELVSGYRRVPAALRREDRDGLSPDRQLVEGLAVVESELARMSEQLAAGDLTKLATQGKYLELKYRGDESLD